MTFYFHKITKGGSVFFTHAVIEWLIKNNGHKLTDDPAAAQYHLVSLCDVTQIFFLERVRKKYPDKVIIAGGHFCINFKLAGLFADLVNVGAAFELFKCKDFDEMTGLASSYVKGIPRVIQPSTLIEWEKIPVFQTSVKGFHYYGGTGCKNKCKFCLTTWTNKFQENSAIRIRRAESMIPPGAKLNVVTNAYNTELRKSPGINMMLRDFIKIKRRKTRLARMGLEFATEENRRRFGKPFTDDQLLEALDVSTRLKIEIQFFAIGGIDTREAWLDLFSKFPTQADRAPKLYFSFTNLQYEQFVPVYNERFKMQIENYLDGPFGEKLFNSVATRNKRIRVFPIAYPALALWRTGMQLVTNPDQFDIWKMLKKEKDLDLVYSALYSSGVINTDYRDEVKFWYQQKKEAKK